MHGSPGLTCLCIFSLMLYSTDQEKTATEKEEIEKIDTESGGAAAGNLGMQFFVSLMTFTNTDVLEND